MTGRRCFLGHRALVIAIALLAAACARGGDDAVATSETHVNGVAEDTNGNARMPQTTADSTLQPGALATVAASPAHEWTGPGGRPFEVAVRTGAPASAHARRFGGITLNTSLRERAPTVGQYPCTSCHQGGAIVMKDERIADAHRNIRPEHPRLTGATCSTCHAADNVELLALKSGERATLDHTYRLCAQCHFAQADAWGAGAHGKRLDGWQGRRVVMGCADCHDPHNPTLEARIPFRAPRLERPRRGDP